MAHRVLYPDHIEPLVQFVEETTPEHIVARAHDKLATGTSVKDVASRLGYANIANFTRAFHRWTGHTPSQHRAVTSRARAR